MCTYIVKFTRFKETEKRKWRLGGRWLIVLTDTAQVVWSRVDTTSMVSLTNMAKLIKSLLELHVLELEAPISGSKRRRNNHFFGCSESEFEFARSVISNPNTQNWMKIWKQKSFGMSTNRWSRISDFPKRRCLITTLLIWRETIQMLRRSHLKVSVKDASKVASSWLIYVTSTKPGNWSRFFYKTKSWRGNCDILKKEEQEYFGKRLSDKYCAPSRHEKRCSRCRNYALH